MLIQKRLPLVFLNLLLLSCLINAETGISVLGEFQVDSDQNILPISNNRLLTWNKTTVKLDNEIIYRESTSEIFNVIINSYGSDPAAAIISKSLIKENTYSIILIDNDGKISSVRPILVPFDIGIPKILFTDSKLLLLKPEEQLIQTYDLNGSKSGDYYLFNHKSWDHEKRILHAQDVYNNLFLLGMKSADLKTSDNVSLFKFEDQSALLANLPITIPYFFSFSTENSSAIIGTKSVDGTFHQKPYLIFLDNKRQIIIEPIELAKLPQKTVWINNKLILIYRNHLLIYRSDGQSLPEKIAFTSRIFPLDTFRNDESVFIVSGKGIGVTQKGNYYESIELVEYNSVTHSLFNHYIQNGPIQKVEYFPSEITNEFYLILNNQLNHLRIVK